MSQNRILHNPDGKTVDEVVFGDFHIEQMDTGVYWFRCGESHFWLRAEKGKLLLIGTDIDRNDFPLIERHVTRAELKADPNRYTVTVHDGRTVAA